MAVNLNTKLGPLTTKMWIIVVGGLGVGLYIYRRSQAANAATAVDSADATAGVSGDTPVDSASYYQPSGGGGGFYDGSNFTPAPAATPPPAPNPAPVVLSSVPARSTCLTNLHKYNTLVHTLSAQINTLKARHRALTAQIRATKDPKRKAAIHAQDVQVQAQVRALTTKMIAASAAYNAWKLRCIPLGVVA